MKIKLLSLIGCFAISMACQAGQYIGLNFGPESTYLTNRNDSGLKVGYKAGFIYGYAWDNGIRAEMDIAYRKNHYRTKYNSTTDDLLVSKELKSTHSWAYMANVLYEIRDLSAYSITPYIGAGMGYCNCSETRKTKFDKRTNEEKLHDDRFAYQAIIGASYPVAATLKLGAEYKYFIGQYHAKNHSVGLTLVKSF